MPSLRYLSLCSGIEATSVAWEPLGWEPIGFCEIEEFPSAVLAHRFPSVPNYGDMTQLEGRNLGTVDIVVGGTPCQGFSIAGKRCGLADERSGLALQFVGLVSDVRPRWLLWENVPGVLSVTRGRDFGTFIRALDACGYHLAWRVLDACRFGVPQCRRRVYLVGHSGNWRCAAKVLFESESLRGHFAQGNGAGKPPAAGSAGRSGKRRGTYGMTHVARCLTSRADRYDVERETFLPSPQGVRRLTPLEYERLQGFPDGWTDIPWRGQSAPDRLRYRALGNAMCVPVMRWIGERIARVNKAGDGECHV